MVAANFGSFTVAHAVDEDFNRYVADMLSTLTAKLPPTETTEDPSTWIWEGPTGEEAGMLGNKDAVATIAVRDIKVAKKFYEGTLGLKVADTEEPGVLTYKSGSSLILVYESQYAGTNQATAITWIVDDDVEEIVRALKAKGVTFEHYDDLPDTTRKGDVHIAGRLKAAWLKDPDGNILAIVSQ